jgi:hypothetical protein
MKLYPPYSEITAEVRNPQKFMQFLKENTDSCHTGRPTRYKGDFNSNGFIIERNLNTYNTSRPQIHGVMNTNPSGVIQLSISIQSRKTIFYFASVFSVLLVLMAIVQLNPSILLFVPIPVIWFWVVGLVLHQIELGKTKLEVDFLLDKAKSP